MKKVLLLTAFSAFAVFSFGQVALDWSVDQIIKPTQINSTSGGTAVPMEVVLKNLGTDSAKIGDSVFFSMNVSVSSTPVIYYPTSNPGVTAYFMKLTKNLGTGDTIHFVASVN